MARETTRFNREVVEALGIGDGDRVVEVGFGHGRTLATMAERFPHASFAGLDISADALRVASRRCRAAIANGRMELRTGDAATLPWPDAEFAKALTVHTIYFWPDPVACLRELRRVLRPDGRLVVGFRERSDAAIAALPASIYRLYEPERVAELLRGAGFGVELRRAASSAPFWLAIAS